MGKQKQIDKHPLNSSPSDQDTGGHMAYPCTPEAVPGLHTGVKKAPVNVTLPPTTAGDHVKNNAALKTTTTPAPQGDCFQEIQEAIDRLAFLAWERWGEDVDVQPDDLRDALVDVRPLARELDGLWSHLRRTLGR